MRKSIIFYALFIIGSCGQSSNNQLFKSAALQQCCEDYLLQLKDIHNSFNNPTTTFINIFKRNDSTIVIFDSQPEITRVWLPNIHCSYSGPKEIMVASGYYLGKMVFISCQPKYVNYINRKSVTNFTDKELEHLNSLPRANCCGWQHDQTNYREYFLKDLNTVIDLNRNR